MKVQLNKTLFLIGIITFLLFDCFIEQQYDFTEYSKNYTESKFLQIKQGMKKEQVEHILGKPLKIEKLPYFEAMVFYDHTETVYNFYIEPHSPGDIRKKLDPFSNDFPRLIIYFNTHSSPVDIYRYKNYFSDLKDDKLLVLDKNDIVDILGKPKQHIMIKQGLLYIYSKVSNFKRRLYSKPKEIVKINLRRLFINTEDKVEKIISINNASELCGLWTGLWDAFIDRNGNDKEYLIKLQFQNVKENGLYWYETDEKISHLKNFPRNIYLRYFYYITSLQRIFGRLAYYEDKEYLFTYTVTNDRFQKIEKQYKHYFTVKSDILNLRKGPSLSHGIIKELKKGEKVLFLQLGKEDTVSDLERGYIDGSWVKVKTPRKKTGWCFDGYLIPD